MKIFLENAVFVNRAPFDILQLDFLENDISVLTGVNGKGKTTIISYIVDAFHEIAKPYFSIKNDQYYRLSGSVFNLEFDKPSYVYLRFNVGGEIIDYVDIRNQCSEEEYDEAINLTDKIPFSQLTNSIENNLNVKKSIR